MVYATGIIMRRRISILMAGIGLILILLLLRLAWLQFIRGDELTNKALENRLREVQLEPKRGVIYDRNGKELAISVSADSVGATPSQIKDPVAVAEELAPILEMDKEKLIKLLSKKASFVWIANKIDSQKARKIREKNLPGISLYEEPLRYYPNGSFAAHLLGFVQFRGNIGGGGIEAALEKELRGIPGKIVVEYDAAGRPIPQATHRYYPSVEGNSVVLTIDETIQHFVERELDKVMEKHKPAHAAIIVMDVKTGEILAMGVRPTYDPNQYFKFPHELWSKNFAVADAYEPGSTFKVITAAAALEEGVVRPQDRFYDPGFKEVLGKKIKCWKAGGHGSQSFVEVAQNSCNPGFIEVALRLGVEKFSRYVRAFGFGRPTGISLPGEGEGILVNPKKATQLDLATMAIGQSNAVTPIQLITAVAAVANDGMLMKPQVVKEIRDIKGNVVRTFAPQPVRQVISTTTARELRGILEHVVARGTGQKAYLEGYRAAGKTGTAQKAGPGGGYVAGKYVASFVGFAPADNPRVAALVVIDEPQGGEYYGGVIAAPVFGAVMGDTLKYLGVMPQLDAGVKPDSKLIPRQSRPEQTGEKLKAVEVPSLVNLPVAEARQLAEKAGLKVLVEGEQGVVQRQFPLAGAVVTQGTEILLSTRRGEVPAGTRVTVPDVSGKTLRDAATLLALTGLRLEAEGSGVAYEQSIAPGEKVVAGTVVRVKFRPPAEGGSGGNNPTQPTAGTLPDSELKD